MFSRTATMKSTETYLDSIKKLRESLDKADAVVIGAGAFDLGGVCIYGRALQTVFFRF